MRLQIQSAQQQLVSAQNTIRQLEMLGMRNSQIVEDTARVLGHYFITLNPDRVDLDTRRVLDSVWRIPIQSRTSMIRLDREIAIHPVSFLETILPILEYNKGFDDLRAYQHVEFRYNGHRVAYAVSDKALLTMPKDMAVRYLTEKMAIMMIDDLKK